MDVNRSLIEVEVIGRRIFVKMPKNKADILFIRAFRYTYWDNNSYLWVIPNYQRNLDLIKEYFGDRLSSIVYNNPYNISGFNNGKRNVENDTLLAIKKPTGRLCLIYQKNNDLDNLIHSFPYSQWDGNNKWWSIPYSDIKIRY